MASTRAVFQQQLSDKNNNTGGNGRSAPISDGKVKKKITDFFQVKRVSLSGKQQNQKEKQDFLYLAAGNITAEGTN